MSDEDERVNELMDQLCIRLDAVANARGLLQDTLYQLQVVLPGDAPVYEPEQA